jgi:hypothetical protein
MGLIKYQSSIQRSAVMIYQIEPFSNDIILSPLLRSNGRGPLEPTGWWRTSPAQWCHGPHPLETPSSTYGARKMTRFFPRRRAWRGDLTWSGCGGGGHHKQAYDGVAAASTFDSGAISVQGMERAGDDSNCCDTTPLSSIRGHWRPKFCRAATREWGRWARVSVSFFEIWAPGAPIYKGFWSLMHATRSRGRSYLESRCKLAFSCDSERNPWRTRQGGKLPSLVKTPGWRRWWYGLALATRPWGEPHEDGLERLLGGKKKKGEWVGLRKQSNKLGGKGKCFLFSKPFINCKLFWFQIKFQFQTILIVI